MDYQHLRHARGRGAVSAALRLERLTVCYDGRPAIENISGEFAAGSLTAVMGGNGAGKTTLLLALAGMIAPAAGRIERPVSAQTLAYLPQEVSLERDFPLNVAQLVATGLWRRRGALGAITGQDRDTVGHALKTVGLEEQAQRGLAALSSGQFRRALFARLLVQDAALILLDEPFTSVDDETVARLLSLILRWREEGRTVICALHDEAMALRYFPWCLLLAKTCAGWGKTAELLAMSRPVPRLPAESYA
ncbi:MAG: ABC transporter ATP-binding protein [Alphaproteobacteria bacterium]|nr:ABC transporter ATP-binding protein [Alphaproteobacteria bacterium]